MKILILILLFLLTFQNSKAQKSYIELRDAYYDNSKSQLWNFFVNWHNEIPTITTVEFNELNDTLKNTYLVFKEFYQPQDLRQIGNPEFGYGTYDSVKFFIVQNEIKIYFQDKVYYTDAELDIFIVNQMNKNRGVDTVKIEHLEKMKENGKLPEKIIIGYGPYSYFVEVPDSILIDSIENFRPSVNSKNYAIPVYLNEKYDNILTKFLGNEYTPLGQNSIISPAHSEEESEARKKFLENFVLIFYGHWGGYWQLLTYPDVSRIIFDQNMEYAKIDFRMIYQGGEAFLKNNNGKWELISSELTWIE